MSDSEYEQDRDLPPPKKRKFAFKKLAQRIAEVDVDVYRQLAPVRTEPLPGATSFFQEALQNWRELNAAEHFLQAAATLHGYTQSLPLLLHHKDDIVEVLLGTIRMEAALSLEPLLSLLGTLARDLQSDYMQYVPRILEHLADLIEEGAEAEPELLQHIFGCLSMICSQRVKQFASDLPEMLKLSRRLRHHRAAHIRHLTAVALSYCFRHSTTAQLRTGVRTVLAEHAAHPTSAKADGAGCMLAETAKGVSHGLHSKASQLLSFLLLPDLLAVSDFKKLKKELTASGLRDRNQRIVESTLSHLLEHGRRGKLATLWEVVLSAVDRDVGSLTSSPEPDYEQASRSVASLVRLVEFHRGSRVEDYRQLFNLATRLCSPEILVVAVHQGSGAAGDPFVRQILKLLTALLAGNTHKVGASLGLEGIKMHAPSWGSIFELAPTRLLLPFLTDLLLPPSGGREVAGILGAPALGALTRVLCTDADTTDEAVRDTALPLVVDLCQAMHSEGTYLEGPFLCTMPNGLTNLLPEKIKAVLQDQKLKEISHDLAAAEELCGTLLCAAQCLPYACGEAREAVELCDSLLASTQSACEGELRPAVLAVQATALSLKAKMLAQQFSRHPAGSVAAKALTTQLQGAVVLAIQLVKENPTAYSILEAAATTLTAARKLQLELKVEDLCELLLPLQPCLLRRSQAIRRECLRILTAFQQPAVPGQGHDIQSDVLHQLAKVESVTFTMQNARTATIALRSIKTAMEFGKIPDVLGETVIRGVVGTLNIRFSLLWDAATEALVAALEYRAEESWPAILAYLQQVQCSVLSGTQDAINPDEERDKSGQTTGDRLRYALEAGRPERSGGATDASVRLKHILKALSSTSSEKLIENGMEWVPLFLRFVAAKGFEGSEEGPEEVADENRLAASAPGRTLNIGAKAWRAHLKQWLDVVAAVKSPKSLCNPNNLKLAIGSQLTDRDPGIQEAALKCLKGWKMSYLNSHLESISRLASDATLREELASFPLAKSAAGGIAEKHRPGLVAVLIRVLWPKMRKRSGRLAGKGAPGSARSAILNFLAAAEPSELRHLLLLFMHPLSRAFRQPDSPSLQSLDADQLFREPWWAIKLGNSPIAFWLETVDVKALAMIPVTVKIGFLNAATDLVKHLGHRLEPFLPELTSLLVALLQTATLIPDAGGDNNGLERRRDIRSSSLRLLAVVWTKFPHAADFNALWPPFFLATETIRERLSAEVSADRAPPLLEAAAAFAGSLKLLPLFLDKPSRHNLIDDTVPPEQLLEGSCADHWAVEAHSGTRLMGEVVRVLGARTCAQPAKDTCLGVVESLLDYGDVVAELVLERHMSALLDALRNIATSGIGVTLSQKRTVKGTKAVRQPGGRRFTLRALAILERLADLNCAAGLSSQLVDALLPLLLQAAKKREGKVAAEEVMVVRVLNVLRAVWSQQCNGDSKPEPEPEERQQNIADALAPLAGQFDSRQANLAFSASFQALAGLLPRLMPAARLLSDLNAVSKTEIDEIDYDARLGAYRQLTAERWREVMDAGGAAAVLHRAFADLRDGDDLALRHASSQAVSRALTAISARGPTLPDDQPDTTIDPLLLKVVYPALKRHIAASNLAVRQEHLSLMRSLCLCFPLKFGELRALADTDIEVDFFANVGHLQMHRRIRALHRLVKLLKEGKLSAHTLLGVGAPLLVQMIVEGRSAENAGHELKDADKDRGSNVVDEAVKALRDIALHLSWPNYQQLLGQFLKAMQRTEDSAKAVIRAVCTIIDAFHFQVLHKEEDRLAITKAFEGAEAIEEETVDREGDLEDEQEMLSRVAEEGQQILSSLTRRVLPVLQSALVEKAGEAVRTPIALALVKLLRILPPEVIRAKLPKVLQGVANLLRNRLQRIRDDARSVLASMVAEMGPQYLPFALDVLESALPEKGYMGHVRGYTLHFLLEALAKDLHPGSLDDTLPRILAMIEPQLFGIVGEEQEAGVFGGTREAKKLKAYNTFQILAQGITFRTQLSNLLQPVRTRLRIAGSPTVREKLIRLLQAGQKGLADNSSATAQDVLIFVSGLLETVVPAEAAALKRAEAAAEAASRGKGLEGQMEQEDAARHQHLLLEFGLRLMQKGLKKGTLGGRDPAMLAMLDPLLPLLVATLRSRHSPVVEVTLRIFTHLVQLPLPGLASAAPEAGEAMTLLLEKSPSTTTPIAQECLCLLAALMKACPEWAPTQRQLRFLIVWALSDIEAAAAGTGAFTLLRGIIKRKLLLPEVYDVMVKVEDLMIFSQVASVRKLCSTTLLIFLLDYPVGTKRFDQHMQFLLRNLSYDHESGRLAAIDMLTILFSKLPRQLVTSRASVFFLPLITRLVSDPSARCRKCVAEALQGLLKAVDPNVIPKFMEYCSHWLAEEDVRQRRAALQAYSLILEVDSHNFGRRIRQKLPRLTALLADAAESQEGDPDENDAEDNNNSQAWQDAYYTLQLLNRLIRASPVELRWKEGSAAKELWRVIPDLLLHRHLWVRKLAADLLGLAFTDETIWRGLLRDEKLQPARLAALFCQQLEAPEVKEAALGQTAKCLNFLALHLWEHDNASGRLPSQFNPVSRNSPNEGINGEDEQDIEEATERLQGGLSLYGLVKRMSRLADDRTYPRQSARVTALKFLAALASRLGGKRVAPFLSTILKPLFRITEGLSPNPPQVKDLAQEVLAHIREVAGADALVEGYTMARQAVTTARAERKRQQAIQAMLDPEAAARGKLQKQARRAAGRKRKMEEVTRMRAAGVPLKNKKPKKQRE